jgi:hypothetical protein
MVARYEYLLEVEGLGLQAVTHEDLEQTIGSGAYEGVRRVVGLRTEQLRISEEVDILGAELSGKSITFSVVDRRSDRIWTSFLVRVPSQFTWLADNVSTSDTTIVVYNKSGFATGDLIHIGTETMRITGQLSTNSTGDRFTVSRAQWGTLAQAHFGRRNVDPADPSTALDLRVARISHTYPASLKGRRVRLYRYERGVDSLTGTGNIIWRGVVSMDTASIDTKEYSIGVDHISKILDQDIGSDINDEALRPRGIYIPWRTPVRFTVTQYAGASPAGTGVSDALDVSVVGHFETQEDFCAEIQSQLDTVSWSGTLRCDARRNGWVLAYITDSSSPLAVQIRNTNDACNRLEGLQRVHDGTVAASTQYIVAKSGGRRGLPGAGLVPRGIFGVPRDADEVLDEAQIAHHPHHIYLGGAAEDFFTGIPDLYIEWPDIDERKHYVAASWDAASRRFLVNEFDDYTVYYTPEALPSIKLVTTYGTGTVESFRSYLVSNSPANANLGTLPFLTSEELASWSSVVSEAAGGDGVFDRRFVANGTVKLQEMLSAEMQALGIYPVTNSDAKIAVKRIVVANGTESLATTHIVNVVSNKTPPKMRRDSAGSIATWSLRTGYDAIEDKYFGQEIKVRDGSAFAEGKGKGEIVIKPKSVDRGERADDPSNYPVWMTVAQKALALFGRQSFTVTLPLLLRDIDPILLGDVVQFSCPYLPDPVTGDFGMTKKGICIARDLDLHEGKGTIDLLVMADADIGGYAPCAWIDSQTLDTGTTWDISVTGLYGGTGSSMWGAAVSDAADLFFAGDAIKVKQFGASTAVEVAGVIDSISGNNMTITLDSTWTPGSDEWTLEYDDYSSVSLADGQRVYVFIANQAALLLTSVANTALRWS